MKTKSAPSIQILLLVIAVFMLVPACTSEKNPSLARSADELAFSWNNANIYFLLTDRFYNGDLSNDVNFDRNKSTAVNRGFQGGDLAGVTKKIKEGYFNELGITALWMTPFFEQIHGQVDEGTGETYGFHGYWAKDWTALDPNFGTMEELAELIETAHAHGIRIVMDVVINHTGPVTDVDPVWPADWVRTGPRCTFADYKHTVTCTLVENLPDIRTESEEAVELPPALLEKWEKEGRLEKELAELDAFFEETGYPRAPKYYIIKWLTDYVKKFGINGYRLDTAKHTEEGVWKILRVEADKAINAWNEAHPDSPYAEEPFYMVGEVYNYGISGGHFFNFGDTLVDFYAEGIDHLINFEFKYDANNSYEQIFSKYSDLLNGDLEGNGVLNYISSHDDGGPFDIRRERTFEAGTKLLLCPGASQVYYGDETARPLIVEGASGDANLRSFMNWDELASNTETAALHTHFSKLGKFRSAHPAVGAGTHQVLSETPYIFKRSYMEGNKSDVVVIGLDLPLEPVKISVEGIFEDGSVLKDAYSGLSASVENGFVEFNTGNPILLIGLF